MFAAFFLASPCQIEHALMTALYELLGARADDDAEDLKKACRKAVKAPHTNIQAALSSTLIFGRSCVAAQQIL
jgi:curved DNA-binding protein CbpA